LIKLTYCLKRLPGLSPQEFHDYWLNHHGPLVKSHTKAMGCKKYVQVHALIDQPGDGASGGIKRIDSFDGVAELWWESFEAVALAFATPEGQKADAELLEDEKKFLDMPNSPKWWSEEHLIHDES
jgi:uncharacterized protein (TIGR02118 family)